MSKLTESELLYLDEYIDIDRVGRVKIIKLKDLLKGRDSVDNYEKFMITLGLSKYMFGNTDLSGITDFHIFSINESDGKTGLMFCDEYIFIKKFDIREAMIWGLKLVFETDDVRYLEGSKMFLVKWKDDKGYDESLIINSNNYNLLRDMILQTNNKKKLKFSMDKNKTKKEKKYSSSGMKGRFDVYKKHKADRIRRDRITFDDKLKFIRGNLGYENKDKILEMTMYDFNFEYDIQNKKDNYEKTYDQYLAGVDPKQLDMTHWSIRK